MLRFFGEAVSVILFFVMIRSVISTVWRMLQAGGTISNPAYNPAQKHADPQMRTSGELRKDPSCGMFVATTTAWTRGAGVETVYFCSKECRDTFEESHGNRRAWGKSSAARS